MISSQPYDEYTDKDNRSLIQSFSIFKEINNNWVYVSDPAGEEYFASAEETIGKLSVEDFADIPTELSQDIAKRIRDAAEMGDVTTLNAIAEEIKDQSDSCMLLSKQIVQMAEDFDLDGIHKLADDLDSY